MLAELVALGREAMAQKRDETHEGVRLGVAELEAQTERHKARLAHDLEVHRRELQATLWGAGLGFFGLLGLVFGLLWMGHKELALPAISGAAAFAAGFLSGRGYEARRAAKREE